VPAPAPAEAPATTTTTLPPATAAPITTSLESETTTSLIKQTELDEWNGIPLMEAAANISASDTEPHFRAEQRVRARADDHL
jgi:hypothetical protein